MVQTLAEMPGNHEVGVPLPLAPLFGLRRGHKEQGCGDFPLCREPRKPQVPCPRSPALPVGTFVGVGCRASEGRGPVPAEPPSRTSAALAARPGATLALSSGSVPQLICSQVSL